MLNALQWFVDLGSIVVLPILIFIFGIILGTKPSKAFTSALTVGVGFVGLNLVIEWKVKQQKNIKTHLRKI